MQTAGDRWWAFSEMLLFGTIGLLGLCVVLLVLGAIEGAIRSFIGMRRLRKMLKDAENEGRAIARNSAADAG
ncbi:hypothetical protein [Hyphomonas sp.]|uniref:hypothetical protein n=1 Tax=Hyphomonas sp. TaxID=87 RepID=UPI003918AB71